MLKNKAQLARESIKTTPELPASIPPVRMGLEFLSVNFRFLNFCTPAPPPPPHKNGFGALISKFEIFFSVHYLWVHKYTILISRCIRGQKERKKTEARNTTAIMMFRIKGGPRSYPIHRFKEISSQHNQFEVKKKKIQKTFEYSIKTNYNSKRDFYACLSNYWHNLISEW